MAIVIIPVAGAIGAGVAALAGGSTAVGMMLTLKGRMNHTTTAVTHLMNLTEGTETTNIRHFRFV